MDSMTLERFEGCLLRLALGDALGAPYEGGPIERLLWRLIGTTKQGEMRWTDDTQMALDVAESLVAKGVVDADDLARRFASSYRWSRGYGPGAAKLLKRIARGADWRQANLVSPPSTSPCGSWRGRSKTCKASSLVAVETWTASAQWPARCGALQTAPRACRRIAWRSLSSAQGWWLLLPLCIGEE